MFVYLISHLTILQLIQCNSLVVFVSNYDHNDDDDLNIKKMKNCQCA